MGKTLGVLVLVLSVVGCACGPQLTEVQRLKIDYETCEKMGGEPYVLWGFFSQYVMCNMPLPLARDR